MYRLFVTIDLPVDVKEQLRFICYGVPGANWLDDNQLHLTLRFIGEVDGGVFKDIAEALALIRHEPFELELRGVGCFPLRKTPKSIWVGVSKNEILVHLQKKIDTALIRLGLKKEGRKFSPHITLAHLKESRVNKIAGYLAANGLFKVEPFLVEEFCLYSSYLSSQGAIHQLEESYPMMVKGAIKDEKLP
ncbi:MAG: RNA 2',3'-cyclic phosphodiesterase [candidate division Zixibacteria bacterium]|nr:RNA 2',3'-cyclic phosphodiesterase [candidate division Zixibacteria bacterium]MDD5426617.1 RNA 2',3'-cyclic phosphodiesterase [candidate division Zixibacteria bacterium]